MYYTPWEFDGTNVYGQLGENLLSPVDAITLDQLPGGTTDIWLLSAQPIPLMSVKHWLCSFM